MATAAALRSKYPYRAPEGVVDHLVVGAGVVGLACARQLSRLHNRSTFLVERHEFPGQETSSRNSEVVHAGLYYGSDSLKTKLCCQGRPKLYRYAEEKKVPYSKMGKLIVATSPEQKDHLFRLQQYTASIPASQGGPVPTKYLSGDQAREMEPDLSPDTCAAVFSPETGIVDTHTLMESLENDITESGNGELVYGTRLVRIDRAEAGSGKGKRGDGSDEGWVVQTISEGSDQPSAILAKVVVNAAGLNAHNIVNQVLPRRKLHFCKGSYFSYKGPGASRVKRLIYPCPDPHIAGLGTHLTMNMQGALRFGPDIEWLDLPQDATEVDFWSKHLNVSEDRLDSVYEAVKTYLHGVDRDGFAVDYAGIRPKLDGPGQPAADFEIKHAAPGFINLMGIESPGLTSCFSIAEMVEGIIKREVLGLGKGKGRVISETGDMDLSAWG